MQLRTYTMIARRLGRWALIGAVATLSTTAMILDRAHGQDQQGGGLESYCGQTPDPAACQQLLHSAISKGMIPSDSSGGQSLAGGQGGGQVNGIVPGPAP